MKNKLSSLFIFYLIVTGICLGQNDLKVLEKAYKKKSFEQYEKFLNNWQKESEPVSVNSLNGLEKDVHSVFRDFYNPFDLEKVGIRGVRKKFYNGIKYVLVQNSIDAVIFEDGKLPDYYPFGKSPGRKKIKIEDFRPDVKFDHPVLYLFPKYKKILNDFLLMKDYKPGMAVLAPENKEVLRRSEFLNSQLKIIYGHWGGYWHLETHPFITIIGFNPKRNSAKIYFRFEYQGGFAEYKKENGKWQFKNALLTWIE